MRNRTRRRNVGRRLVVSGETTPKLLTSLLAHWPLDEASGSRADAHTGGWDLAEAGGVGQAAGVLGDAALFDGVDDTLESATLTGDWQSLDTTGVTVCGWVYPARTGGATNFIRFNDGAIRQLVNLFVGTTGISQELRDGGGSLRSAVTDFGVAPTDQWSFVAGGYDASERLAFLYVNGDYWTEAVPIAPDLSAGSTMRFARFSTTFFPGRLDSWSVFKRRLSYDELNWLRNQGAGRSYPFP